MDAKAIHCILTSANKDSLIASQKRVLVIKDSIEVGLEKSITILTSSNESKQDRIEKLSSELGKCRKSKKKGVLWSIPGVVAGWFLRQAVVK